LRAGEEDGDKASAALTRLCQTYWYPLYGYVRRRGYQPEDAQDLTQEFFARILAKDYLKGITREGGKFRSFLLVMLKRFLANEWQRKNSLRRGGGREILTLNGSDSEERYRLEPPDPRSPEKAFERRCALTLLNRTVAALEKEFSNTGRSDLFAKLKPFVTGDMENNSYAEISRQLGITEGTLRVNVNRMRKRYRALLRLEIGHTVEKPEDIDDEIRNLFAALAEP